MKPIELLLDFIKNHPHDLEKALNSDPYFIKTKQCDWDPRLWIFKYSQIETKWMSPKSKMAEAARGLVINLHNALDPQVVCYAFDKFFNYGEGPAAKLDISTTKALEKIDGSLIRLFWWAGDKKWVWATNGSFDANAKLPGFMPAFNEQESKDAKTFQDLINVAFNKALKDLQLKDTIDSYIEKHFNKDLTYMFELVSPMNKIVIPYEKTELIFLGARNNKTYKEYSPNDVYENNYLIFKVPTYYDFQTPAEVLFKDDIFHEGVVLCDADFNRVKVKMEQYVIAHKIKGEQQLSEKHLYECILEGKSDDVIGLFPEYSDLIEYIISNIVKLKTFTRNVCLDFFQLYLELKEKYDDEKILKKIYAQDVLSSSVKWLSSLLFDLLKNPNYEISIDNWIYRLDYETFTKYISLIG